MEANGFKDMSSPPYLGPVGKREYARILKILVEHEVGGEFDRGPLYAYCEAFQEFNYAVGQMRKQSQVVETIKGNMIQNPWLGVKNKAAERMLKFAKEFGMTPLARSKIDADGSGGEDEFEKFLSKKKA